VINVDFTRAHDIPGCADDRGFLISSEDYARDILAAANYLAKEGSIDPTRIHVMGWSFGGGAAFSALALAESESIKINSVVAFFPLLQGRVGLEAADASADARRLGRQRGSVRAVQGFGQGGAG